MGFIGWVSRVLGKTVRDYQNTHQLYLIGCEVMGQPRDWRSPMERAARVSAGRKELARRQAAADAERRKRGNPVRDGIAAAGVVANIALTGGQAYDEPAQNSQNTQGNYADSKANDQGANQARGHRRETTYKGRQQGGSGGRK